MPRNQKNRQIAARLVIHSQDYEESGSCIILQTSPLTILVPSHVCVAVEDGTAQKIEVDGVEFTEFRLLPAPFLEREHLSVVRFNGRAPNSLTPVSIPRRPSILRAGTQLECIKQTSDERNPSVCGRLTEVIEKGTETTLITDISASPGDSGSPLLAENHLVGVCVGMTVDGEINQAVAVPLSQTVLRELRRIALHTRRLVTIATLTVGLLFFGGLAIRSWATFDVAGVEGPMNTTANVESPNTITASNGQIFTLRPTWKRTFPTSIRWWVPLSITVDDNRIDRIAIGTVAEEGIPGSLFLLDNLGRTLWSYTVPDGECVYNDDTQSYDGFKVYRVFVGDLTGDGQNEVLASFTHQYWYPCKVVLFDLSGEILGEYWHPGYVRTFAIGPVGGNESPMLIMTGSNNRFRAEDSPWNPQGIMAFQGADLQGEAPPYTGSGSGGNELWYYLLPDMDDEHKSSIDNIVIADSNGDGITEILAHASDDRFYYLNEYGEVLRVDLGDEFLKEFGNVEVPELIGVDLEQTP